MSRWVDFGVLKQSIGIEQVLASYRVESPARGAQSAARPLSATYAWFRADPAEFNVDTVKYVWAPFGLVL